MAWPGTLTAEEQEIVQTFVDQMYRPAILNLVKSLNIIFYAKEEYTSRVSALLAGLVAGDFIPNGSGYASAEALTVSELQAALTVLNGLLTSYNDSTHRDAYVKAIGSPNMARVN